MASAEEKARPSHSCQSCRNLLTSIPDNPPRLCLTQLNCYVEDGCALFKWVISRAKKHYGENLASDTQVWFSRFGEYDEATKEYRDSSEAIVVSIDSRGSGQRQITEPLMLQAQEGTAAAEYVQSRPYVQDRRSYSHLWRQWADHCDNNHPACRPDHTVMPSRLIHIADDSTKPQISIRQVAEGSQPEYAALSYSWGGDQNFKTTRDRLPGYQANISWETLKPYSTITDVIRVTQALGLEYLWIDALCIVQDDDDDKACELGKMGGIYAGASITTRASMCTTSRDAFMNTEFPQDERPICEVMLPVEGGEAVPVLLSKPPDSFREPIDSRAWCFQERLLSRRILSFDSRFTWWNCQGCVKMDGGPDSFALGITTGAELVGMDDKCLTDPKESLKRWIAYVKDYQARQLTVGADKLQAIAAVAEYLQQAIPGQYLAGLWSYELNSQLLWHTIPPWPDKIRPRPPFRAPSWSWASVDDSRVEFETDQWGWQIEDRLQIDGYSTEPIYPQVPFGAVNAASLTVTGRLKYVMLEEGRVVDAQEVLPGGSKFTDSTFSVDFSADAAEDRTYLTGTKAIYMLEVAINSEDHVLGLILKLKAPNMYERIGMFRVLGGILPKPDMDSNDASDSDLASDAELVLIGNGSHDELALDSDQLQAGSDGSQDSQHVEWDDADDDYSIFENAPAEDFFSGLERVKLILL